VWFKCIAVVVILSLMPATTELIEAVVHYVEHGDLAHADKDDHGTKALGTDEHGCAGTFHLCSCHTAVAVTPVVTVVLSVIVHGRPLDPVAFLGREGVGASAPAFRPPIA
jgi:hypothetical protein